MIKSQYNNSISIFIGPVQHSSSTGIVLSKNNPSASGQPQRIMVRQPDGTNLQFAQQIKQQHQQGRIIQSSSGASGSQTKMISAAELQKLISSGAVKTVTRTTGSSQSVTSDSTTTQIVRQMPVQERMVAQQQVGCV